MIATLFVSCLVIGSLLAIGSVIGTSLQYASAWEKLAGEKRNEIASHVIAAKKRPIDFVQVQAVVRPPEITAAGVTFQRAPALCAAA